MRPLRSLAHVIPVAVVLAAIAGSGGVTLQAVAGPSHGFDLKSQDLAGQKGEPNADTGALLDPGPNAAGLQDLANRAYPASTIPSDATEVSRQTWNQFGDNSEHGTSGGQQFVWNLIGPNGATQDPILSFSGGPAHMSGRVTSLVIAPHCSESRCRLWVAAAGGGVWRTDNALSPKPSWVFTSGSFLINAIGTLDQDPSDPTGNTLYAGTGEPNSSIDSEAGVGIYKTTNGGDSWRLLPGSSKFRTRSIGKIVIDPSNPNHLYVGLVRGVRGVTSVQGGSISQTGPCVPVAGGVFCGDGPNQAPLGLYESTNGGNSFSMTWDGAGSVRGVNHIGLDPQDPATVYASAFQRGIWRRSAKDGTPATFQQVFRPTALGEPLASSRNQDRTEFDLTVTGGNTRIYAGDGAIGAAFVRIGGKRTQVGFPASFWRADGIDKMTASALLATQQAESPTGPGWQKKTSKTESPRSAPYRETFDYCTGQCWYDNLVYTPKGHPDTVFLLGSYSYGELRDVSNARAVLMSTTAGDPNPALRGSSFNDLTWDASPPQTPHETHPDEHAVIVDPDNPNIYFEGSDGGIIRNNGQYVDDSGVCATYASASVSPDSRALCDRLLSRVPQVIFDTLNLGLSTLQFNSLSINPKNPLGNVQGGTQDNGTLEWKPQNQNQDRTAKPPQGSGGDNGNGNRDSNSRATVWDQSIYGDGGQSGYNYSNPNIRFNSFFTHYTDENFRAGQHDAWVVTSGPLSPLNNGGETAPFYMAEISDYVNFGYQYAGESHVWRTTDNGGNQAYLEANCPEFTASGDDPACGDWKSLAGPSGNGTPGDLTSAQYGSDRLGAKVAAVERTPGDAVTLWAATGTGRVFISHNVNAPDPHAVRFCRIDTLAPNSPPRFVSSIHPDPNDPNHAWISYSGYNTNSPGQPGHVFDVHANFPNGTCDGTTTAVWRDLHVEQNSIARQGGDIPITDLVRDDKTGDLYAATDFGVLRGKFNAEGDQNGNGNRSAEGDGQGNGPSYTWMRAGINMPNVEVSGLTIDPCSRVIYAATHGRSAWQMFLNGGGDANPKGETDGASGGCPRMP